MARALGIRIGARRFEVVALDGNPKHPKVTAAVSGEIPAGMDPVAATAGALKEALKGLKLPTENIGLAIDSGHAAFRTVKLPFDDEKKVEQVIKFEVENNLPQWSIEDVVVDWHVLSSTAVESVLLTTSVPKEALEPLIAACERAGVEPNESELECTAVVNAAHSAGVLDLDAAQILVHVGEQTTSVAIVDGGRLAGMRAVHVGALAPPPAPGGVAVESEEGGADAAPGPVRDMEASVRRLRRELGRTVAAEQLTHPLDGIYVSGFDLPGLIGDSIDGVPIVALEVFPEEGGAGLEGKDARERSELTVAYGVALGQLGGGLLRPSLRREELHYAGKFERLELPLAVFALLLVTMLLVQVIVTEEHIRYRGEGKVADPAKQGDMQLWLKSSNNYLFDDPENGNEGRMTQPPPKLLQYAERAERGEDEDRTKFEQIEQVRTLLRQEVQAMQRELGDYEDFSQPMSALEGATLILDTMSDLGESMGRFSIRQVKANTSAGNASKPEMVIVTLDMTFFAQDDLVASQNYEKFYEAVQSKPWCLSFEPKKTTPLPDGNGISVDAIRFDVDVNAVTQS